MILQLLFFISVVGNYTERVHVYNNKNKENIKDYY